MVVPTPWIVFTTIHHIIEREIEQIDEERTTDDDLGVEPLHHIPVVHEEGVDDEDDAKWQEIVGETHQVANKHTSCLENGNHDQHRADGFVVVILVPIADVGEQQEWNNDQELSQDTKDVRFLTSQIGIDLACHLLFEGKTQDVSDDVEHREGKHHCHHRQQGEPEVVALEEECQRYHHHHNGGHMDV